MWQETFLQSYRQPLKWWWLWFSCACLLVIGLCIASLINLSGVQIRVSDKTLHFVAYWGVCLWWLQVFKGRWVGLIITLCAICLGIGLEIAQSFHPMRHMDYRDAIANSIGAGLGYLCAVLGLNRALLWTEGLAWKVLGKGE